MPREIESKSILNKTKRRDPWFLDDYTVNPFSSCSFNCLFCYIRGSKYGEHMGSNLAVKTNAVELLRHSLKLRARKGEYGIIVLSSATDPYLKIEREIELTRRLLEVILEFKFPVHIITRSDLVLRDLDLLHQINHAAILPPDLQGKLTSKALVSFSFSSLQDDVASIFEPGAISPSKRLDAVKEVRLSGLKTGICLMPLLPYISDTSEQLELAYTTFSNLGVDYLFPATITLWGSGKADSKTLVMNAIRKHFPHLEDRYRALFKGSTQLPSFYRQAFNKKANELRDQFGIPDRIVAI